jgi:hypothetical protein
MPTNTPITEHKSHKHHLKNAQYRISRKLVENLLIMYL